MNLGYRLVSIIPMKINAFLQVYFEAKREDSPRKKLLAYSCIIRWKSYVADMEDAFLMKEVKAGVDNFYLS
jgi:hypothetical protein